MFTNQHLYFDDVSVGQEWWSSGRTITEADVVHFAGVSGDFNPIHVDHQFAAATPFRKPIAHGLLGLVVSSGLSVQHPLMRTVAFLELREWKFHKPIYFGDTVRVKSAVLEMELQGRGKRGRIAWKRSLVNHDNELVQEGVTVTLVECRRPGRDQPEA